MSLKSQARILITILNTSSNTEQKLNIIKKSINTSVALVASLVLDQHPSGVTLITLFALDTRNARAVASCGIARESTSVCDDDAGLGTITVGTAGGGEVPVVGQTLVTLAAIHARLALTLTCISIALSRQRPRWITVALVAALTLIEAPLVVTARGTVVALHILFAGAFTRLVIAGLRTTLVTFALLTVLERNGVSKVPVFAFSAVWTRCVVQALETFASVLITRVKIVHVNVAIALTWLAWNALTWISKVTGGTSLTEVAIVTRLTVAVVRIARGRVDHTTVSKHCLFSISWTWTEDTVEATAIRSLHFVVSLLTLATVIALRVVTTLQTFTRLLVTGICMPVTLAPLAIEFARPTTKSLVVPIFTGLTRITPIGWRTCTSLGADHRSI